MKKVIEAKIGNSITRYEDLWILKLECGHTLQVSRPPRSKNGPPKKKDCRECDAKLDAVTQPEPKCHCGHGKHIHTFSGCDSLYCRCNGFASLEANVDDGREGGRR